MYIYSNYAICISQGCEMDIIIVCISKKTGSSFLRYVRPYVRIVLLNNLDNHCFVIGIFCFC
jgi:hypothetical protein